MVRRQCTAEYKIVVVNRAIRRELHGLKPRQRVPKDTIIYQSFGISTDEAARAERAKTRFADVRHTVPVYPLIAMGWSRTDCVDYLRDRLPHTVPKSSCVFCPYRTNQSWAHLKRTDPEGWERAVQIDAALRDKSSVATRGFRQEFSFTAPACRCRSSTSTPWPHVPSTRWLSGSATGCAASEGGETPA